MPEPMNDPEPEADGPTSTEVEAGDGPGGAELAEARRQRDEYLDQLQRSRAEFANYQKRARAQAETDRQYAVADLARDLLPVLDNFERALEAARKAGATSIVEGLEMVHRQLLATLAKHGVEPIPALGQPFDPNQHEALMQQPHAEHPEGTVVGELTRGYRLRDRVLRPSQVAVSIKPAM
jgi:molecular chaperone GrpE